MHSGRPTCAQCMSTNLFISATIIKQRGIFDAALSASPHELHSS